MNKTTIALLEEAQQIYEQTVIDSSKLDEIAYSLPYPARRAWR
jgi:hypothetical protein